MNNHNSVDTGAFVLRVTLGVMYMAHSVILKYFMFTLDGTAQFFVSLGLPAALAYVTFIAEAVGGVLLVLGVWPRAVALTLLPILLGAVWVHSGNGWVFTSANGGWEYPVFLAIVSVVQALIGDGAFTLRKTPSLVLPQMRTI
jgi:putative oxidoreductase